MQSFGKSDPDVEDAQAAAHAAHKIVRSKIAQSRIHDKQTIIRPRGRPRQHDQKDPKAGADADEHQHGKAMDPNRGIAGRLGFRWQLTSFCIGSNLLLRRIQVSAQAETPPCGENSKAS